MKKTVDAINAERRILKEKLEQLEDDVRGPLTAYEEAEKQRIAGNEATLAADIEHRKAINREAMSGILSVLRQCGITEATLSTETGKALVTAIARNEILHVKLEY